MRSSRRARRDVVQVERFRRWRARELPVGLLCGEGAILMEMVAWHPQRHYADRSTDTSMRTGRTLGPAVIGQSRGTFAVH